MIYKPSIYFFTKEAERLISNMCLDEIKVVCAERKNPRPYKDALDLVLRNPVPYEMTGPIWRLE